MHPSARRLQSVVSRIPYELSISSAEVETDLLAFEWLLLLLPYLSYQLTDANRGQELAPCRKAILTRLRHGDVRPGSTDHGIYEPDHYLDRRGIQTTSK